MKAEKVWSSPPDRILMPFDKAVSTKLGIRTPNTLECFAGMLYQAEGPNFKMEIVERGDFFAKFLHDPLCMHALNYATNVMGGTIEFYLIGQEELVHEAMKTIPVKNKQILQNILDGKTEKRELRRIDVPLKDLGSMLVRAYSMGGINSIVSYLENNAGVLKEGKPLTHEEACEMAQSFEKEIGSRKYLLRAKGLVAKLTGDYQTVQKYSPVSKATKH